MTRSKIIEIHTDKNLLKLADGTFHRVHSHSPYRIHQEFCPEDDVFAERCTRSGARSLAHEIMRELPLDPVKPINPVQLEQILRKHWA